MKWFRHFSDAHTNEGLRKLKAKFGNEGVGIWWTILEIIAAKMDKTDRCYAEFPISDWCSFLGVKQKKLSSFLVLTELELSLNSVYSGNQLRIECPKLLELRDEYTTRVGSLSGETPPQKKKEIQKEKQKEKEALKISMALEGSGGQPPNPSNPSSFEPSIATEQTLPSAKTAPQTNGQFQPPPEIKLLANDLIQAAGIGDRQDRRDVAWDVYHAVKAGNEQEVHIIISEIKAGEHLEAENITAVIRARLKEFKSNRSP